MMKKTNEKKIANKCQIFTPTNYVKELLDSVGYHKNIVNKTILENSCGDGNILVEIVNRYIEEAIELKFSNKKIKKGLENNIDVSWYAKKDFDWMQMKAIREGLEENLNVSNRNSFESC